MAADGTDTEATSRAVRVYDSVRTAHLERFQRFTPATVLFHSRRYDFDPSVARGPVRTIRLGRAATFRHLLRSEYGAAELSEPLMSSRWLDLALQVSALRVSGWLRGERVQIGAYCIGFTDPAYKLRVRRHVPTRLARIWSRVVLRVLVRSMDRLAFGTQASYDLLAQYVPEQVLTQRARRFPAVSSACDCPFDVPAYPTAVLFVGALTERKGVRQLMQAWDVLRGPGEPSTLTVIGKGDLQPAVEEWARDRDEVSLVIDPPREDVHRAMRCAHVLVLLSQRVSYWREQVGLPIVEGLSHGCEIVTTEETGLASWLAEHGHRVLASGSSPATTASAIRAATHSTRSAAEILADLPEVDPRLLADRWMLQRSEPIGAAGRPGARAGTSRARTGSRKALARSYAGAARRAIRRYGFSAADLLHRVDDRPVFVVGSPRSGTSFTAESLGAVRGFVDLGELRPLKLVIPDLVQLPEAQAAQRIRTIVRRSQRLGTIARRHGIEQTPESTYLIPAIVIAFPKCRFVHLVRDGRDVATSLIQLGWVSAAPAQEMDEVGHGFGSHARFWVEPERSAEFEQASQATRAAWVWRRYESAARSLLQTTGASSIEIRYEDLLADPQAIARRLACFLQTEERLDDFASAFARTRTGAHGRWRRELSAEQQADVLGEAGGLLAELGYVD